MKLLILSLLFLTNLSHAALPSEDWIMFCGDKKTLLEHFGAAGETPTTAELKEANESRKPILKVLAEGKKGIAALLEEGNRTDTGPFGVLLACGVIDKIKHEIKEKGCYSLTSKTPVKDKGGIKACAEVLSKLPRE